jgi:hypothetical protein
MNRKIEIPMRLRLLSENFGSYVEAFMRDPPFDRPGQFENHQETIRLRRELGSAQSALDDEVFLENLYTTLLVWGIGVRASRIAEFEDFVKELRGKGPEICALDGLSIDDGTLDVATVSGRIWKIIDGLAIVSNKTKVVSGTKALHHLLPDLVVPMDRAYTQRFLGWHNPEFQSKQKEFFRTAFQMFVQIARANNPAQYVGSGWCTSRTKVLDNALVGFCLGLNRAEDGEEDDGIVNVSDLQ